MSHALAQRFGPSSMTKRSHESDGYASNFAHFDTHMAHTHMIWDLKKECNIRKHDFENFA